MNNIHIVPHENEWAVQVAGTESPASVHDTQQAAIEKAVAMAEDEGVDVVVHRRNGSFRNVIRYETIEGRASESPHLYEKPVVWGVFAAGALSALAVYLTLHPPERLKRHLP